MPLLNLRKPGVSSTKWSSTIRLNMAPGSIWSRLNYPSWSVNVSVSVFPIWLPYNAKCPLGRSRAMLNALPFIGNFLLKMHAQNCPVFILHFPCVSLLVHGAHFDTIAGVDPDMDGGHHRFIASKL